MAHLRTRTERAIALKRRLTERSTLRDVYHVKTITYGRYREDHIYGTNQYIWKPAEKQLTVKTENPYIKRDFTMQRSSQFVYQLCKANAGAWKGGKTIFFTLTDKEQIHDIKKSNEKIKKCIRRLNRYTQYPVKYIIVPEKHKSGAIHYHGIFFNLPKIRVTLFRYEIWGQGYVDLQMPKKIKNVSAYLTKYLVKTFSQPYEKGTKRYFTSRGLIRPMTTYHQTEPDYSTYQVEDIEKKSKKVIRHLSTV